MNDVEKNINYSVLSIIVGARVPSISSPSNEDLSFVDSADFDYDPDKWSLQYKGSARKRLRLNDPFDMRQKNTQKK